MIEQQGQVVAVVGEMARVRIGGSSGCPACDAGKGCGAGIFGRLVNRKPTVLELATGLDVRVGQVVMVGLPESVFLLLVTRLYLLPLLAGLAGAVVGHYISVKLDAGPALTDGCALLGAFLATGTALVWSRNREFPGSVAVHLLRVLDRSIADQCVIPGGRNND